MAENKPPVTTISFTLAQPSLISSTNNPLLIKGVPNLGGINQHLSSGNEFMTSDINNPLLLRGVPNLGGINQNQSGEIGGLPYKNLNANNNNNFAHESLHGNMHFHNKPNNGINEEPIKLYQGNMLNPAQILLNLPVNDNVQQQYASNNNNVWDWIHKSGSTIINKVLEKTKDSVDTVITTFDPQMKDYLRSSNNIALYIGTKDESLHKVVKDAFQKGLGLIVVPNLNLEQCLPQNMAPQCVGFSIALHACEQTVEKIKNLVVLNLPNKGDKETMNDIVLVLAIESFIVEITPSSWYHNYCLYLSDVTQYSDGRPIGKPIQMYTEAIPLPNELVDYMVSQTPPDYPNKWSGLLVTVEQALATIQYGHAQNIMPVDWATTLVGRPTDQLLASSLALLVEMYKVKNKANP